MPDPIAPDPEPAPVDPPPDAPARTAADDILEKKKTAADRAAQHEALTEQQAVTDAADRADTASDAVLKADLAAGPVLHQATGADGVPVFEYYSLDAAQPAGYSIAVVPLASAVPSTVKPPEPEPAPPTS